MHITVMYVVVAPAPAPENKTPAERPGGQKERARPHKWVGRLGRVIALLVSGGNLMCQLAIHFF